ncbi:hypothetical protein GCM10009017_25220 [Halarchaeum rubridurum]|nr:hypothetical protein GCM10009017_25220 [Halarchaeum rubridurum]
MFSLSITLPTLEVSSAWTLASWLFGIGLVNGFLERNRWHQPEVAICVLTEACKTVLDANCASSS